jgi:hypothetical protein
MSTKTRVVLTVAGGIVMGLTWLISDWTLDAFVVLLILLPLVVGRWWVVAALIGPLIAVVALELTGHVDESGSDGTGPALLWGVFVLNVYGLFMLILVGIRKVFDFFRRRRVAATSGGNAFASNGGDS